MIESISYEQGLLVGRMAIILYMLTLIPGIARRFGIKHKVVSFLTLYRQKLGIAMYSFAILHAIVFLSLEFPMPAFRVFGLIVFILLLPLFLTANRYSITKLKQNWKKVHQLTYPALGFLFLHTVLIRTSVFSVSAFFMLILLVASFIVERMNKSSGKTS